MSTITLESIEAKQTELQQLITKFKADCLNGAPHDLKMSSTYPRQYSRMQCKVCDFERNPTPDEFKAAGIELETHP